MAKVLDFISTSDWHLDGLKTLFPGDHLERQLSDIRRIYEYAIDNGIEHIFVPGDLSDTPRISYDAYIGLMSLLTAYDGKITTHYIAGNHDFAHVGKTSLDFLRLLINTGFLKTTKVYASPEQIKIDGVRINMLPHPAKEAIESDKPCLNFCHVEVAGAINDTGRPLRTKATFGTNPGDYTISGHIHQFQILEKKRFTFCGSPYQKNFGESLPKGFIQGKARMKNGKLDVKIRFVDNKPNFQLQTVLIKSQKDFAKLDNNPNIKYRLYLDEGIVLPKDLRVTNRSVAQVLDSRGKTLKELNRDDDFKQEIQAIPSVNPFEGLLGQMREDKWKKSDYKEARMILDEIMHSLSSAA